MTDFLIYDGKVALALLVFYLFYRFLLKKETFHRFNRMVLVGTAGLSFLLPLCIITIHKPIDVTPVVPEPVMLTDIPAQEVVPFTEPGIPWWPVALSLLFWAGVAFVLARVLVSILSILKMVRTGELMLEEDGCKVMVTERDIDPFSWMKYIVLSRKDWEAPHASILTHEKAHIAYGHSAELLLVDILSAFQWFNPAIWMLRADLQELHEYEADNAVLRSGANIREYQYLLIRKAVSKSGYSVANSFNHSILKNRITMMSKSKSPLSRGWRVLWMLPLVCLGLGLQARTVYVPIGKDSEKILADETTGPVLSEIVVVKYAPAGVKVEDIIHVNDAENFKPTGQGAYDVAPECSENFGMWLNRRLRYPKDCLYEGSLLAMFTVGEDGKVGDVKIVAGICDELNEEVTGHIIQSPAWTPAMKDGKPVATVLFQPVTFVIRVPQKAEEASTVSLKVRPDGKVESGGQVYSVDQLKDIVPAHKDGDPLATVQIVAAEDVRLGVIEDVKKELRELGALKIRYYREDSQDGVNRYMPPMPRGSVTSQEPAAAAKRENVFAIHINAADKIFFGDKPRQDEEEMVQVAKAFLKKHGKETRFCLVADRGSSYGAYTHIQELLIRVYTEVRNEKALEVYGKPLSELSVEEKNQINYLVPIGISEAEPKHGK